MTTHDNKDKIAIVTGGAQGIGLAVVKRLLASGTTVAIWDRDAALASSVATELGERAYAYGVDVTNTAGVEEVAARVDVQYELPLYRSRKGLRALDLYVNGGLLLLADWRDLRVAVPGYEGAARLPVDLTFDIGLRMDTRVGTFQLGFSTLLGFLDL